nr:hypothetical protein [Rhodococcus sp. P14]
MDDQFGRLDKVEHFSHQNLIHQDLAGVADLRSQPAGDGVGGQQAEVSAVLVDRQLGVRVRGHLVQGVAKRVVRGRGAHRRCSQAPSDLGWVEQLVVDAAQSVDGVRARCSDGNIAAVRMVDDRVAQIPERGEGRFVATDKCVPSAGFGDDLAHGTNMPG